MPGNQDCKACVSRLPLQDKIFMIFLALQVLFAIAFFNCVHHRAIIHERRPKKLMSSLSEDHGGAPVPRHRSV